MNLPQIKPEKHVFKHGDLTEKIIGVFYEVYNEDDRGLQSRHLRRGAVILELKASRVLEPAHEAQLLNYLRATDIEVGLLLNFGVKPQFKRMAFDNDRKRPQIDAE